MHWSIALVLVNWTFVSAAPNKEPSPGLPDYDSISKDISESIPSIRQNSSDNEVSNPPDEDVTEVTVKSFANGEIFESFLSKAPKVALLIRPHEEKKEKSKLIPVQPRSDESGESDEFIPTSIAKTIRSNNINTLNVFNLILNKMLGLARMVSVR